MHACAHWHTNAHAHACMAELSQHQPVVHKKMMQLSGNELPSRSYSPNPVSPLEIGLRWCLVQLKSELNLPLCYVAFKLEKL